MLAELVTQPHSIHLLNKICLNYLRLPGLWRDYKEYALISRCAFCAASDQNLDFLSHMSIFRKHFSCFLHNLKTIYEYMKKADLGKHYLLLHKPGFPRWCHKWFWQLDAQFYGKSNDSHRVPDKTSKINFNWLYLCYFFTNSYVWPLVRIVSLRRF